MKHSPGFLREGFSLRDDTTPQRMPQKGPGLFWRRKLPKKRIARTSPLLKFEPSSKGDKAETGFSSKTINENKIKIRFQVQGDTLHMPRPTMIARRRFFFLDKRKGILYVEVPPQHESSMPPPPSFIRPPHLEGYLQHGGGGLGAYKIPSREMRQKTRTSAKSLCHERSLW